MNPSLQRIAGHGDHLSIPAKQRSQQSGRWTGLDVRRIPAQFVKALLNRFPRSSIKYCQDILTVSAIALMDFKLISHVDDYDATASVRWTATLGLEWPVIMACFAWTEA